MITFYAISVGCNYLAKNPKYVKGCHYANDLNRARWFRRKSDAVQTMNFVRSNYGVCPKLVIIDCTEFCLTVENIYSSIFNLGHG